MNNFNDHEKKSIAFAQSYAAATDIFTSCWGKLLVKSSYYFLLMGKLCLSSNMQLQVNKMNCQK